MKKSTGRDKSRRAIPWKTKEAMTPSKGFISAHCLEHYEQRHPALSSTGETGLINTCLPKRCPYCGCEKSTRHCRTRIGVHKPGCGQAFPPTAGIISDKHGISISEWIGYCLNLFRNVGVNADSWNNRNAFSTSRHWIEKPFLVLGSCQDRIIVGKNAWLDETYHSVMLKDAALNEDGPKPGGLSKNKTCIGVATDKTNTAIIAESYGKPSQKMSHDSFISHIEPHSTLVHDKESAHGKLAKEPDLVSEAYGSKEPKGLEDLENPLDPVNHMHCLVKRFPYAHGGFERSQAQSYLNLYPFILNPPGDKLKKVDILLNLAFENPKSLRYRDRYTANRDFPPL